MKKLEVIIKPERLEDLKELFNKNNISGVMVTSILGYGHQKGYTQIYRGTELTVNMLPKLKVETVVPDDIVDALADQILSTISTGNIGDGKIFIYNVEDAIRIRTGERGENAV